jgi:3-hydroxyanthranilate 3,4-dioxygenase
MLKKNIKRWFCEKCTRVVYDEEFVCTDLGKDLKPIIERYYADSGKRTCKECGHVNAIPPKAA